MANKKLPVREQGYEVKQCKSCGSTFVNNKYCPFCGKLHSDKTVR